MTGPSGPDHPADPDGGRALRWPAGFSPECSDVWARSELVINAPPVVVFSRLVAADCWERDFRDIRDVRILAGADEDGGHEDGGHQDLAGGHQDLGGDTVFEFEMDGLRLSAQVSDFAAGRRLAWSGQGIDIITYHAWVISSGSSGSSASSASSGSSTSRALAGFAARGAAAIALRETGPGAAQRALDRWTLDLKTAAERTRP